VVATRFNRFPMLASRFEFHLDLSAAELVHSL
jgi:hypothetical protein